MIKSPLMGLVFDLQLDNNQAQLHLQSCIRDVVPGLVKIEKELALLKIESITLTLEAALSSQQQRVTDLFYDTVAHSSEQVFNKKLSIDPRYVFH